MALKIAGSISVGKLAPKHTLAKDGVREQARNVSSELTKDNVILVDRLGDRSIEQYTDEHFQPVIDAYNAKQKRSDRKINVPYTEWHAKNGNLTQGKVSLAYECVIQIGEHDSIGKEYYKATGERREKIKDFFQKDYAFFLKEFQERYKHLTVLYAAIHFDEKDGTPHMHLCYQPEAECSRGLSRQVSIGRALAQDGFARAESRLEAEKEGYQMARMYRSFHHDVINKRIQAHGYEIKEEVQGRKHDDKSYFKDMMDELDQKKATQEASFQKREEQVKEIEMKAESKSKAAEVKLQAAFDAQSKAAREVFDAEERALAAEQALIRSQEILQGLEKRIKSKEQLKELQENIDEIYRQSGSYGSPYPEVLRTGTIGHGHDKQTTVTIREKELNDVKRKAAIYDDVCKMLRKVELLAEQVKAEADTDERLQSLTEKLEQADRERTMLRAEVGQQRTRADRAESRAYNAEKYIDDRGWGEDFDERTEHHTIHHRR